jgi:hypothetical protein
MNSYSVCAFPVRNVVALKEPIDKSTAKRVFVDRGTLTLEKAHRKEFYRIKLASRGPSDAVTIIPIHFIQCGEGKNIKSNAGLRKNKLTIELNQVFDTNLDYLERIIIKMDREDAAQFSEWFVYAWNNDERRITNSNK